MIYVILFLATAFLAAVTGTKLRSVLSLSKHLVPQRFSLFSGMFLFFYFIGASIYMKSVFHACYTATFTWFLFFPVLFDSGRAT